MSSNFEQFKRDFEGGMKKAITQSTSIVKKVAFEVLRGVVQMSPVDTGRFKGNWQVGIVSQVTTTIDNQDKSGASTLSSGLAQINQMQLGQTVYITNNLPYARRLEFDAWSKQAPQGMVAVTLANVVTAFESKKL